MTPIPRTLEEQRALVEHTVECWRSSEWYRERHPSGGENTKSRKDLRARAKQLVLHCLIERPVVL